MSSMRKIRKRLGRSGRSSTVVINRSSINPTAETDDSERLELEMAELEAILARVKSTLSQEEYDKLHDALKTLLFVTQELEKKRVSVQRLKQLLFGATTEKTRKVLEKAMGDLDTDGKAGSEADEDDDSSGEKPPKEKAKGHGRNGADDYTGAEKVQVAHPTLKGGDDCPKCKKGKVYEMAEPRRLVRLHGQAPLGAAVYELQKFRCNLCGKIFTAPAPPEVGEKKYDAESAAMIALLKYGSGVPFNRLKGLQGNLGIPLPTATQWDVLADCAPVFIPIHESLILIAAQGKVIHNDDTTMKVLNLPPLNLSEKAGSNQSTAAERKGVFTSGIVAIDDGHTIALYFTGHKHAGENMAGVLIRRAAELEPPIQMCDALSRNVSDDFKTILANCLSHGRRKFIDVVENFPAECRYVLELLGKVYENDETTRREKMSDRDRLIYHQANSKELMDELKQWMRRQLDDKLVEPNSGLGEAISYMLKHWKKLTLFLEKSGAPLDNNICERALKKAILHRKNAYFYKTANGARVGDLFMSLIHTCELNKANPFDYLTELQKHAEAAALNPADWMPWNYRQTLSASQSPQNA